MPAELTDIKRVDSINILGVTVTNTLTMNEHVDRVLSNCAQSVFALKTLRAHGLNRECLHNVFNAVILAKRTYGANAWISFTRASEREGIEAFIRRCLRSELCSVNIKNFTEMCDTYDYRLFNNITRNSHHILLPSVTAAVDNYNLSARKHNRMLPQCTMRLCRM